MSMDLSPEVRALIQRIIDEGAPKLIEQGHRSYDEDLGGCAYRNKTGDKCLIGQCIPDSVYDPSIEGLAAPESDVLRQVGFEQSLSPDEKRALDDLQEVHDYAGDTHFVSNFVGGLSEFCADHGFTLPDAVRAHVEGSQ